jgi:YtkA-like protein
MRVASAGRLRVRVRAGLAACCLLAFACAREAANVTATWTIEPAPASTATATSVRVVLKHADGKPASGAQLRIEAHMAHPGMEPLVTDAIERENGTYESRLNFSMPGRWVLVVTGTLADGRRLVHQTEITVAERSG